MGQSVLYYELSGGRPKYKESGSVGLKIRLSPTPPTSGHRRVGALVGPASILTLTTIIPSLLASQDNRNWGEP